MNVLRTLRDLLLGFALASFYVLVLFLGLRWPT